MQVLEGWDWLLLRQCNGVGHVIGLMNRWGKVSLSDTLINILLYYALCKFGILNSASYRFMIENMIISCNTTRNTVYMEGCFRYRHHLISRWICDVHVNNHHICSSFYTMVTSHNWYKCWFEQIVAYYTTYFHNRDVVAGRSICHAQCVHQCETTQHLGGVTIRRNHNLYFAITRP